MSTDDMATKLEELEKETDRLEMAYRVWLANNAAHTAKENRERRVTGDRREVKAKSDWAVIWTIMFWVAISLLIYRCVK